MEKETHWKKSEVVIPERETAPEDLTQANPLLSPATGDSSGGLDGIGTDVKDVVKDSKPSVDIATAINLVELKGRPEHIEQFKKVSCSQFDKDSMSAVETPSGLPIGIVYTLIGEAQKHDSDLDLTLDKIIIHVKLKNNCKKCNGKGYMGRAFDPKTLVITDKLFKCTCLKTILEVEKGQPEEETEDVDSNSESE